MDRELIERLAIEAGAREERDHDGYRWVRLEDLREPGGTSKLAHFAALIAEECAKAIESKMGRLDYQFDQGRMFAAQVVREKFSV